MAVNSNAAMQKRLIAGMNKKVYNPPKQNPILPQKERGGVGITNYNNLQSKPKINGGTLQGEMTLEDIGLIALTEEEIQKIFNEVKGEI